MNYYLARWEYREGKALGQMAWRPPLGAAAFSCIDMRTFPAMAARTGSGHMFLASETPVVHPDAISLGDGTGRLTLGQKAAIRTELGYGDTLVADRLHNVIQELFVNGDPTGTLRWRPLQVRPDRTMRLRFGDFDIANTVAVGGVAWTQWLRVKRQAYRETREEALAAGTLLHRKRLAWWARKWGIDYHEFIPSDLPDEGTLEPATTISDDFNRSDESLDAGSWTEVSGDWSVSSNQAIKAANADETARHTTALSGDDHDVSVTGVNGTQLFRFFGPVGRFSASAETGYYFRLDYDGAPYNLYKVVTGTHTEEATAAGSVPGDNSVARLTVEADALEGFDDGVSVITLDPGTGPATGSHAGMYAFHAGSESLALDDFSAEDIGGGAADPEGRLVGGKLIRGGLLKRGVLV